MCRLAAFPIVAVGFRFSLMSASVETALLDLIEQVPPGKSVSPEEVARALDPENWRRQLRQGSGAGVARARRGRLSILRHRQPGGGAALGPRRRGPLPAPGPAGWAARDRLPRAPARF